MSSVKNILIFASGNLWAIGGLQRSYEVLTGYLVRRGHRVTLAAWQDDKDSDVSEIAFKLPHEVSLRLMENNNFTNANFLRIRAMVQEVAPDVVLVVNSSQPGLFLLMAARGLRIPVVYSIRGSAEYCLRYSWPCMHALNLAYYGAVAGHVLMPSYKSVFPPAIQDRLRVIPSQIEPAARYAATEAPGADGRFAVLYSGRFSFEKRVDLLVRAFAAVMDSFPAWDLWLYGDGPLLQTIKTLVEESGIGGRVRFGMEKNTEDMYKVYPQSHLMVLPSEQEGCPMALREAMAHRVPVIAFAECSGSNEIITSGKDGLLIDNDDRVGRLAESMTTMMGDPVLRQKMGAEASVTAGNYQADVINAQWEILLIDAAEGAGLASESIRKKHASELAAAARELDALEKMQRFRNIFSFARDPVLFEHHRTEYLVIYGHAFFDKKYYLETYIEVKKSGVDPLLHYLSSGWREGHDPSPEFDTRAYRDRYMAANDDRCPLYHYYVEGRFLGVQPMRINSDYYEKWPMRRPKFGSNVVSDAQEEFKLYVHAKNKRNHGQDR
jgi:GalNAc-alpha-(1->4)-GalNAc-alpha-(1->3)-diNAcBac-PP-undecaprenol alpha-1,4-N-acetyl-D-galactosaminyltransferase